MNAQGLGLGLNISNSLSYLLGAENSKGISVKSKKNVGSVFSFEIENKVRKLADPKLCDVSSDSEENMDIAPPNIVPYNSQRHYLQESENEFWLENDVAVRKYSTTLDYRPSERASMNIIRKLSSQDRPNIQITSNSQAFVTQTDMNSIINFE